MIRLDDLESFRRTSKLFQAALLICGKLLIVTDGFRVRIIEKLSNGDESNFLSIILRLRIM